MLFLLLRDTFPPRHVKIHSWTGRYYEQLYLGTKAYVTPGVTRTPSAAGRLVICSGTVFTPPAAVTTCWRQHKAAGMRRVRCAYTWSSSFVIPALIQFTG